MLLDERLAGNPMLKSTVKKMLQSNHFAHSLLLAGESGTGAGFAARCIAAELLFPNGGNMAEAMLRGDCCRALSESGEKDGVIETGIVREAVRVDSSGVQDTIKVGQIRAAREEAYYSGLSTDKRVILIFGAEKMLAPAANALLKLLEEPPENVFFLLTTVSQAAVLPTIRSRCIILPMAPVSREECIRYCTKKGVAQKDAALYTDVFDGKIGSVMRAASDKTEKARIESAVKLLEAAEKQDTYTVGALLAPYEKDRPACMLLLDNLCALAAAGARHCGPAELSQDTAIRVINACDKARERIMANGNRKVVLTVMAIGMAGQ